MFKIERIDNKSLATTRFRLKAHNTLEYCSYFLTILGRTWQIKYSSKLNYFFIAHKVRRNYLLLDALSLTYLRQIIQSETGKKLTDFSRLDVSGAGADFFLRCRLDGEDVFVKVLLGRIQGNSKEDAVLENEYEKSMLMSEVCPYILKPIHYINLHPCEIMITPFIENLRPLRSVILNEDTVPEWVRGQIEELSKTLKDEKIVHRDINGNNLVIGNIKDKPEQIFLIDCAFMTHVNDDGTLVPTNLENRMKKHLKKAKHTDDSYRFAILLNQLDEKLASAKKSFQ